MNAIYSSKKFIEFQFEDSADEENPRWKSALSEKKKSRCGDSSVYNYTFLESFAGGIESKGKKLRNETIIVHEVDEAVKERIYRSDAALQSSSSNYSSKTSSRSRCHGISTSYPQESFNTPISQKTDRKDSECKQWFHLADNQLISIISDEDTDLADAEGSSGERILDHEVTSPEMESSVVVYPECVTCGRNSYSKAQLTFFCSTIKLDVSEDEVAMGSPIFEWKTVDLISIWSRWLDPFTTADVCLYIKSEHPELATSGQNSGILELKFTLTDSYWSDTQDIIKSLDEQYKEKWDVDLDSYESFEDITYLEGDCDSISISKRDVQLLHPEKFINDTIVDFYIEYLKKIKPADARVHFFNSFFFRKLADFNENQSRFVDAKTAFQRVRKWTKKVNIFHKDYIFIPVNFRLHWSLIVICHPGELVNFTDDDLAISLKVPCILHMDSIKGSHRGLEHCIRGYLWEEWKERNNDAAEDISSKFMDMRFLRLEVPQQQNSYDCALFMLHYMELFVKQAPINFNPLSNFISKDWFYPTEASLKRARIKRLIFELAKSNAQSPSCNKASSYQLKDEDDEEAEIEILHETFNSRETCCERVNADMDINVLDGDINGAGIMTSSLQEIQSDCEEFSETGDNGGSLIGENEQNHGQMVLYDPSINALSPIKESDEAEDAFDKQLVVTEPPNTGTLIDKFLNFFHLKGNSSSLPGDDVQEALVVEDSDECCSSSSDDVFETCVVEDSDSDDSAELVVGVYRKATSSSSIRKDVAGNRLNLQAVKRRGPVVSEARKRLRRSS